MTPWRESAPAPGGRPDSLSGARSSTRSYTRRVTDGVPTGTGRRYELDRERVLGRRDDLPAVVDRLVDQVGPVRARQVLCELVGGAL